MRHRHSWALLLSLLFPLSAMAADQSEKAAADGLRAKVIEAYRTAQATESAIAFHGQLVGGDEANRSDQSFELAIDRANHRLWFKGADIQAVIHDGTLYITWEMTPERYLKKTGFEKLSLKPLLTQLAFLEMAVPDIGLHLGEPAISTSATELPVDDKGRPGLSYEQEGRATTLRFDPATMLLSQQEQLIKTPDGKQVRLVWDIHIKARGDQVSQALFTFTPRPSAQAVDSLQALLQPIDPMTLKGQAAPAFSLKDVDGREVTFKDLQAGHRVVVLDFWATWCGPCQMSLPMLQQVSDWARDNKLSVAIQTVNQRETPEQVKAMWKQLKLRLPILMDTAGKVGWDYGAQGLPTLMVIADGKIQHVHMGVTPTYVQDLKDQITALLKP